MIYQTLSTLFLNDIEVRGILSVYLCHAGGMRLSAWSFNNYAHAAGHVCLPDGSCGSVFEAPLV